MDGRRAYVTADNGVGLFGRHTATGGLSPRQIVVACPEVTGCAEPKAVAEAPDGRHVYVAAVEYAEDDEGFIYAARGEMIAFARDTVTGALTQVPGATGCLRSDGSGGCAPARALDEPVSVAVSADGRNVYANSLGVGIAAFARDPVTGGLRQLPGRQGCMRRFGRNGCARGRTPFDVYDIALSPDGRNVYAEACGGFGEDEVGDQLCDSGGVAILARDRATGALRQLRGRRGCVREMDPGHRCARARAVAGIGAAVLAPDGRSLYFGGQNGIAVFRRDRATGALHQLPGRSGCFRVRASTFFDFHSPASCSEFPRGLSRTDGGVSGMAISPDGRNLYAVGEGRDGAVALFARNRRSGVLRQLPGRYGCLQWSGRYACAASNISSDPQSVQVSSDGRNVYVDGGRGEDGPGVAIFRRSR